MFSMVAAPIPPRAMVQLRYTDTISLTSSSVTARTSGNQYEFRLNSIYDPNYTSTGHQPYMYDQFAALYGRYRVDRVRVQIDAIASPSTSHCITALVQGPSGGWSINGRSLDSLIENVKAKNLYALTTAVAPPRMSFDIDIAEYLGIGRLAYEADLSEYGAAIASDPSRVCMLNLATSAFAGTSETIQVVVTLVQHVCLWDPVVFGSS